ncbi:hypothetical protein [Caballeronia sp. Lep1P3]|uniref:hypothetical protein n=1 Tax=Caballeronia sp. Lep1P3 TaxID=2878150 RepID=UPI00351CF1C1
MLKRFPRVFGPAHWIIRTRKIWERRVFAGRDLKATTAELREHHWKELARLDLVPVGHLAFYDRVLDMNFTPGNLPERVRDFHGDKDPAPWGSLIACHRACVEPALWTSVAVGIFCLALDRRAGDSALRAVDPSAGGAPRPAHSDRRHCGSHHRRCNGHAFNAGSVADTIRAARRLIYGASACRQADAGLSVFLSTGHHVR